MTLTLQQVKATAHWQQMGKMVHKRPRFTLRCAVVIGDRMFDSMVNHLGEVRERNDGRWNWFVKPVKHNGFWTAEKHEQGVAESLLSAMQRVEQAWYDEPSIDFLTYDGMGQYDPDTRKIIGSVRPT